MTVAEPDEFLTRVLPWCGSCWRETVHAVCAIASDPARRRLGRRFRGMDLWRWDEMVLVCASACREQMSLEADRFFLASAAQERRLTIPALDIMVNTIGYATDLERIV